MVLSSPADVNARCVDVLACFFRGDQKRIGRKCGVKVAGIHFSKTLPLWNLYFHSPSVNNTSIVIQG